MALNDDNTNIIGLTIDDDTVDDTVDAAAAARTEGMEEVEKVNITKTVTRGFLAKGVTNAMLKQPSKAAEYTLQVVREAVCAGHLPTNWGDATTMRAGRDSMVNGIVTIATEEFLTDAIATFIGGPDGLIVMKMELTAASLVLGISHDSGQSPIEFIHNMWRVAPELSLCIEVNGPKYGPKEYKGESFLGIPAESSQQIVDLFIAFRVTEDGKRATLGALTVARSTGAGGINTFKVFGKIGESRKELFKPLFLEARVPVYITGPEQDLMESPLDPCVDAIRKHIGAAGMDTPNARRSCYYRGFKVMARIDMRREAVLKEKLKSLAKKTAEGGVYWLTGEETFEVRYYPTEAKMAAALNEGDGGGNGGKGNDPAMIEVVRAMQAAQAESAEVVARQMSAMTRAVASTATSATAVNNEISIATRQQRAMAAELAQVRRNGRESDRMNALQFTNVMRMLQGATPVVGDRVAVVEDLGVEAAAADGERLPLGASGAASAASGGVNVEAADDSMEVGGRAKRAAATLNDENDGPSIAEGSGDEEDEEL